MPGMEGWGWRTKEIYVCEYIHIHIYIHTYVYIYMKIYTVEHKLNNKDFTNEMYVEKWGLCIVEPTYSNVKANNKN